MHKEFIWNHDKTKIKEETLINNFDKGGLKDVNIPFKITSLQCSWVKRLLYLFFLVKSIQEKIPDFIDPLIP